STSISGNDVRRRFAWPLTIAPAPWLTAGTPRGEFAMSETRPIWEPPPGAGGPSSQPPPPQPPRKSWPAPPKGWAAIIGVVGVIVVLAVIGSVAGSPKSTPTASVSTVSSSPTPSPTPTTSPPPPPLTSTASVTRKHPKTGTTVGVHVSTTPGARITVV